MNSHQHKQQEQTQLGFSSERKTFWTACPSCNMRFLYYIEIVNKALICQVCKNTFIASDVGVQKMASIAKKESFFEIRECSTQNDLKVVQETLLKPTRVTKTKGKEDLFVWEVDSNEESSPVEGVLQHSSFSKATECENSGLEATRMDDNQVRLRGVHESEPISGAKRTETLGSVVVPDAEFHDFDSDRKEDCFKVGQIWAIYDDIDGMPRYYARIKQVYSPGFKVRITWLDSYLGGQFEKEWIRKRLPVACGKFRNEKTLDTNNIAMFSHKLDFEKVKIRGPYMIYPRKGETWAIFKDWDISWSSYPDNNRNYEYEFVEVQSDYTKESGVSVVYLAKVEGFLSLFKPISDGNGVFRIPPNELLRFAHRVPSIRMTGTERESVPEGSFELDPACLPRNLKETSNHIGMKVNSETIGASNSLKDKNFHKRKKRNPEENNTMTEGRKLRNRNRLQKSADGLSEKRVEGSTDYTNIGIENTLSLPIAVKEMGIGSHEAVFYNFYDDKSDDKFRPGQIWALYCELDDFPKYYAKIEKVKLRPNLKLYIKWLESCDPLKGIISWLDRNIPICCGAFKVASGKGEILHDSASLSHQVRGVSSDKNMYKIYPREGEVWALHENFNSNLKSSDLRNCEYKMVEVLKVYHDNWIIVLCLQQLTCFKTVFKAKRESGHDSYIAIPWIELFRFSHQVPAFRLTGANHGSLRGCWELDPKSTPVGLVSSN